MVPNPNCDLLCDKKFCLCQHNLLDIYRFGGCQRQPGPASRNAGGADSVPAPIDAGTGGGKREEADSEEEGAAGHSDTGAHHGQLHRLLVPLLLPLQHIAHLSDVRGRPRGLVLRSLLGILPGLLAGVQQLGPQPRHLHCLQQGLQEGVQEDTVQVSGWGTDPAKNPSPPKLLLKQEAEGEQKQSAWTDERLATESEADCVESSVAF